jgi:hypothetical protein
LSPSFITAILENSTTSFSEELDELQAIIERGPDWNALDRIEIRLNPKRRNYDVTVEQAEDL